MSIVLSRVASLVSAGEVEVTLHGTRELAADLIRLSDVISGIGDAIVVEEYAEAVRGPSVLVLQRDRLDNPLHVLWGIPKGRPSPAVLITAYRPDPDRWMADFRTRRTR